MADEMEKLKSLITSLKVKGTPVKIKDEVARRNAHNIAGRHNMSLETWKDRVNGGYWVRRTK